MPIEGLNIVLQKKEVVPTFNAIDLVERPEAVDQSYSRHVRTYIPVSRIAEGNENAISVSDYEKSVISAVKNARAPRGYLTAEYGYGKTSTALYLWKRAEEAGLVAVPPFQLLRLVDLLSALYGWMKYRILPRAPHLLGELERIYQEATGRSIEREASQLGVSQTKLVDLVREGRFILELQPSEYIKFFEEATRIALEAGFEGVLLLPDEIQQYIEPRVRTESEPLTPLFNLVQQHATRTGVLKFGIIMVIPNKEVGVIRDLRRDLLDRMSDYHLDLTMIYDDTFAEKLWKRLAREFEFEDIADDIAHSETLISLGEIAARTDLSNGPRTVINTFRRMVEKYLSSLPNPEAYTPIHLVSDLISGAIVFSGDDRIPNITRRALQHQIVQGSPERFEPAVKLAAAFPTNGVPHSIQQQYGATEALEMLRMKALGELVVGAGDEHLRGVTLFGLHQGVQQSDWLTQTIRDFRRAFGEQHQLTQERAIRGFERLLKREIFKGWNVVRSSEASLVSNHSIIFEGDYQKFQSEFPKRRVHARILWEDEERKDATIDGDVAIEFQLSIKTDLRNDPEARRSLADPVRLEFENHTSVIPLNLMYVRPEGIPRNLKEQLQGVWAPYDLAPLIFLNLYELMEEKRADNLISPREDQLIANAFQPELMESVRKDLFNQAVGVTVGGVSQAHIVENSIHELLRNRYQDCYKTFMVAANWKSPLQIDYSNALARLGNLYQKRGEVEVEGTKEEIAGLLARTNTGLDTFIKVYGSFLKVTKPWTSRDVEGAVLFTLHPLEREIIEWLKASLQLETVILGTHRIEVHGIDTGVIYDRARELGYRNEEIEVAINLLIRRELVEKNLDYRLREVPSQSIDIDTAAQLLASYEASFEALQKGFGDNPTLQSHGDRLGPIRKELDEQRQSNTPDPQRVFRINRLIKVRLAELETFAQEQKTFLSRNLGNLSHNALPIDERKLATLDQPVNGAVEYVQQVNVLRNSLKNQALKTKETIEKAKINLNKHISALQQVNLTYGSLSDLAAGLHPIEVEVQRANRLKTELDEQLNHFDKWVEVVVRGSELFEDLTEMGLQAKEQKDAFDAIARAIREEISSKNNKIDALPNHTIYSRPLYELRQKVRSIKSSLEDEFIRVKNLYIQALIENDLYRRDEARLDINFNPASVDSVYQWVYERVQEMTVRLCDQLSRKAKDEQKGVETILYSEALGFLRNEQKEQIQNDGKELIVRAGQVAEQAALLSTEASDLQAIKDFPRLGEGKYGALIRQVAEQRNSLGEIAKSHRNLGQHLRDISLSADEESLFRLLSADDQETEVDLVDWIRQAKLPAEEFWKILHSLYDKQRVRVKVLRVRG